MTDDATTSADRDALRYRYEEWLSPAETLEYADYWNDEDEEAQKPFWVLYGDFQKLERYVVRTGHLRQLNDVLATVRRRLGRELQGAGCDLGAGALWAEPHLLRAGAVEKIYCVEYSRHRLLKLGPRVLEHYGVPVDKVTLVLGDLHHLRLADATLDFVFMCAAFYSANEPQQLLEEFRRVLKPGGLGLIIGEHECDLRARHYVRQPLKWMAATFVPRRVQRRILGRTIDATYLLPRQQNLLVTDVELGDHYYTERQYRALFAGAGFDFLRVRDRPTNEQSFVLVRQ